MISGMFTGLRRRISKRLRGPPAGPDRHPLAPHEQRANRIRNDALQARYAAGRWFA